jgi:hypothetical protein
MDAIGLPPDRPLLDRPAARRAGHLDGMPPRDGVMTTAGQDTPKYLRAAELVRAQIAGGTL